MSQFRAIIFHPLTTSVSKIRPIKERCDQGAQVSLSLSLSDGFPNLGTTTEHAGRASWGVPNLILSEMPIVIPISNFELLFKSPWPPMIKCQMWNRKLGFPDIKAGLFCFLLFFFFIQELIVHEVPEVKLTSFSFEILS